MRIVDQAPPTRYQYGQDRAHTAGRCPPAYTPMPDDEYCRGCGYWVGYCDGGCPEYAAYVAAGRPAEAACGAWDGDERDEWAAAELRDEMAARGYW